MFTVKGKYNTVRIMTDGEVDEATLEQVRTMCNLKSLQESNGEAFYAFRYNQYWRCWLCNPTDEERAATPWEGRE